MCHERICLRTKRRWLGPITSRISHVEDGGNHCDLETCLLLGYGLVGLVARERLCLPVACVCLRTNPGPRSAARPLPLAALAPATNQSLTRPANAGQRRQRGWPPPSCTWADSGAVPPSCRSPPRCCAGRRSSRRQTGWTPRVRGGISHAAEECLLRWPGASFCILAGSGEVFAWLLLELRSVLAPLVCRTGQPGPAKRKQNRRMLIYYPSPQRLVYHPPPTVPPGPLAAEYFQQLIDSPERPRPNVKAWQCFTKYRWRPVAEAEAQQGPRIVATQVGLGMGRPVAGAGAGQARAAWLGREGWGGVGQGWAGQG